MRLVEGKPQFNPWETHPEYGFDWKAYRAREQEMIRRGELRPLSDLHQAVDEDLLQEAYDQRAMHDMNARELRARSAQSPLRAMEKPMAEPLNSPRQILNDPEFSGRGGGSVNPWALAAGMLLAPTEIGQDTWDPKYKDPVNGINPWRQK